MYCGICKEEMDHLLDEDGMDNVLPCRNCIKTTYAEGVRTGFQLAGGDVRKLDAIYEKEKD